MKKRYLLLPLILLVFSIIAGMFMMVFTTDFVFNFYVNRDDVESVIKNAPVLELSYKINPTKSTMYSLSVAYNPDFAVCFTEDSGLEFKKMPDCFYEKCVKYQKLRYDCVFDDSYKPLSNGYSPFAPIYPNGYLEKTMVASDYAISLYMNGQKKESKQIIENLIKETNEKDYETLTFLTDYVCIIHNLEKDKDYQNWMISIEEKITALQKFEKDGKTVKNRFALNKAYYVPFE